MSARRRAEPGSQHRAGIADVAAFTGRGGYNGSNGYGGAHRSDRQPASADFRAVLGNFATGVTIITALDATAPDGPTPIGFTCSAFTSLSLDPPLVSFSIMRESSSRPRILAAGRFCVNILAFDQRSLCTRFATPGVDRFAGVDWWHSPAGSPVLDGSLAWIDATVEAEYPGGDHTIVIGHVRGLSYLRDAAPLVYHRGDFANCFPAASSGSLPRVG
jgi:3-hydroxy-9,10-secoandrosta-1,3,5(10)-triene-9,17-dione monooxygenase reductase component